MNEYLDRLDQQIAARHLLTHPFYLAWTRGELHKATLADYACQYYRHVVAFPTYLSAVHARCDDQATRRQLLANLIDEEAGDPNHPQLWRNFAATLGVTSEELDDAAAWPETADVDRNFPLRLQRGRYHGRSRRALRLRKPDPSGLGVEDRRADQTLLFRRPGNLPLFHCSHRGRPRTCRVGKSAPRSARSTGQCGSRYDCRRSRAERALGTAFRRLPPSRPRLLRAAACAVRRHSQTDAQRILLSITQDTEKKPPENDERMHQSRVTQASRPCGAAVQAAA